ncbi:MAG: signal peptidase I [Micrococcaceae bacterium]
MPSTRSRSRAPRHRDDAGGTAQPAARARRVSGIAGEALLWVAALAGLVCIALVVLAFAANITLIMFKTGSMAPTIPAGSVAAVQQVSASEISVGDVVTVDQEDQLPVTHRVTSVAAGTSGDSRVITMRGDANAEDDPFPYEVSSVRTVLFSVPGAAPVITAFGNPFVLGALTLVASVLVGWAFWPRAAQQRDDEESP